VTPSRWLARRGTLTLRQVTPSSFEEYRAARMKDHEPKTVYTAAIIIKGFFKWVFQRRMLATNPLLGCNVSRPYVAPKAVPKAEEIEQLVSAAQGNRQIQYALLAFSGIRAGELQMLRPQDVDLQKGWIRIVGREGWVPKTRQARAIPIHPKLLEYLIRMPETNQPYFFCAAPSTKFPKGDHFINTKHLNEDFQILAKSLGMSVGRKNDGLVIHSLRHYFETMAINSAVPPYVVDVWMGHSGNRSMGKVYYGLSDEKSQEFIRQVKF